MKMMKLTDQHEISWTKIEPLADPKHGKPCARSSHGVSMVQNGTRLIVMGGEHVARTPIEGNQTYWACDKTTSGEEKEEQWQWRCLEFDSAVRPPDRIAHAQAAVADQDAVYMFGGRAGITMEEKAMNDLWKLDCSAGSGAETWSPVDAAEGTPPEARSFHKMIGVGDAGDGNNSLYMFGGCTAEHGRSKDLFQFNVTTNTWKDLGASPLLRGRGGPNLLSLESGKKLGVVAGFAGEETADGHVFDLTETNKWNDKLLQQELENMRPRSVCVSGSFPNLGISIIFGGEVDPSDRGHEGAGGFENDLVVLDETTGKFITCLKKPQDDSSAWPRTRGWSDSAAVVEDNDGGKLYIFGGLSGDDQNPERLDDLWVLNIQKAA